MSPTVYLVSGANRGIGFAITEILAARPDTIVYAGARDPSTATALQALPSNVHIVKLASCDEEGNRAAVQQIKKEVGRLDVVIANAGISDAYASGFDTTPDELREHFNINVVGPQVLFHATYPLLKASTPAPKFIIITSAAGSLTIGPGFGLPNGAYAISKAAVNYLARLLHFENEGLVCFPLSPGLVDTDMVKAFTAKNDSMKDMPKLTPAECAAGLVKMVVESTREKDGGEFLLWDGAKVPW